MTGRAMPADPVEPIGEPFRRKVHQASWGDRFVQIDPYAFAHVWDGQPCRTSSYA